MRDCIKKEKASHFSQTLRRRWSVQVHANLPRCVSHSWTSPSVNSGQGFELSREEHIVTTVVRGFVSSNTPLLWFSRAALITSLVAATTFKVNIGLATPMDGGPFLATMPQYPRAWSIHTHSLSRKLFLTKTNEYTKQGNVLSSTKGKPCQHTLNCFALTTHCSSDDIPAVAAHVVQTRQPNKRNRATPQLPLRFWC